MDIKPIRTDAEHQAALREIDTLMAAEFGTPEGDRLDILVTLVEAYENNHFPIDLTDDSKASQRPRHSRRKSNQRVSTWVS